jgi:ATP-binding protein involved in chromosome partitioning
VHVSFETAPRSELRATTRLNLDARRVVAVASGKGGVGKTTVAVNLAVALAQAGQRVGLLDGDIHGPNVPLMLGLTGQQPFAFGDQIFPPQAHGVTVMSMGLLVPAGAPVIWRGPMLHQALRQLLRDVMWGQLDFLLVDLPPGTGDVQLTLAQSLPLAGAVMVTTPQEAALADVLKGGAMFQQLGVPVLGVVENMSHYVCPHCGQPEYLFGQGGAERVAAQLGTPVIGHVPLDPAVRAGGDAGQPVVLGAPGSASGQALQAVARAVAERAAAQPTPAPRPARADYAPDPALRIIS